MICEVRARRANRTKMNTKYFTLREDFNPLFEVYLGNGLRSLLLVAHGGEIPGNTYLKLIYMPVKN